MPWVVIRRFRDGSAAASTKSFKVEADANAAAEKWMKEGWEVEVIADGGRHTKRLKVPDPPDDARPGRPEKGREAT